MNISQWWDDHGTKILGFIIAGVSTALAMGLVAPKYAPWGEWFLAVAGAGTVNRGFTNTTNLTK